MNKNETPAGRGRAQRKKQRSNLTVPPEKKQGPSVLPVRPAGIPAELKNCDQWTVWRREERDGKPTKVPYNARTGGKARSNDPQTWTTFPKAHAAYRKSAGGYDGVMFAFGDDDPFCGIDLDDCRDPATGNVKNWARKVLSDLGSYAEVSPSGTGVKIYCKGSLPTKRTGTRRPHKTGAVEMYQRSRFFVVTGRRLLSTPKKIVECREQLIKLWRTIVPPPRSNVSSKPLSAPGTSNLASQYDGKGVPPEIDDEIVLARARRAANGKAFQSLWEGDWPERYLSQSEADLALCGMLAFWVGPQPQRIDRLFRQSSLFRDKWDTPHRYDGCTYGDVTIEAALSQRADDDCFDWNRFIRWAAIEGLCDPNGPIAREFKRHISRKVH